MPQKPSVTDEHKTRYASIMGTPVKSNAPTPAPSQQSKTSSLLSAIPKPRGLAGKMFVFTGKKKIIMDGTEREEQKVKTVDPAKDEREKREKEKEEEKKVDAQIAEQAKKVEVKSAPPAPPGTKPAAAEGKKGAKKKLPKGVKIIGLIAFIGAWTFFWMVVFGFISF